jgi:threonine dehydrogenase-like Zn-dependent dehydrogenase
VVEIKTPDGEQSLALWYAEAGVVDLRPVKVKVEAGPGQALVRMLWSGLSRGTERLVFTGRVPASEHERMRAPLQEGSFPFPVKYGYCAVGLVEAAAEAPELVGRSVFCLHPHQTRFAAPIPMLTPLPDALPPRRAVLAANMETALNALWDSGAGPGDRIVVVGAGLVGLLVAYLAAGLPGADVSVVDLDASRRPIAESFGARFATPADFGAPGDADVVFHASAAAAGLAVALGAAALEARVVELSWYGDGDVPAPLGGAFHSRRLTLVSSQVGQVAPTRRPRWSYGRRLAKALELLGDARLEALITEDVAFADLPQALPRLLAPGASGLATVVVYQGVGGV